MRDNSTIRLTDANFNTEIMSSELPVLVDFWASWCPPCKMSEPTIAEMALDFAGKVKVAKINVDQNPQTSAKYSIQGIPTYIVFHNGNEIVRRVGAQSKKQLGQMVSRLL